jgi:hypothetical protein
MEMKATKKTSPAITDALLTVGGYPPDLELTLKLGREIQDEWMNAYQDVQITNTFKKMLRRRLELPMPRDT